MKDSEIHPTPPGFKLGKADVWGDFNHDTGENLGHGMVVARGLPQIDKYFTKEQFDKANKEVPAICPVFGDRLPWKSVTVICKMEEYKEINYWLEYVHGGGAVQKTKSLPDGKLAIRSNYMC